MVKEGKRILIAAHGNSLRALVKHLGKIDDEKIPSVNIPTGSPLVFEFDKNLNTKTAFYLDGDPKAQNELDQAMELK
jgi:2,3-bisphosphoglycerate-dependent phosphoglycerate mutase